MFYIKINDKKQQSGDKKLSGLIQVIQFHSVPLNLLYLYDCISTQTYVITTGKLVYKVSGILWSAYRLENWLVNGLEN